MCQKHGLWGIAQTSYHIDPNRAQPGDRLIFWLAGSGFLGTAVVTGRTYAPESHSDVPWPGGTYRWGLLVPIEVDYVCKEPVRLRFQHGRMELTGISNFALRRGFITIPDAAAEAALAAMHAAEEERSIGNQG